MLEHTPGPWHWDSDPIKGDPLNRLRYRVTAIGRTITQCYYSSEEGGQAEADARLIAAAPALLAVYESVLDIHGDPKDHEPECPTCCAVRDVQKLLPQKGGSVER